MNIDNLINDLSADLRPVTPLASRGWRFFVTLILCFATLTAGIAFWYWRKGEFHIPLGRSLVEASLLLLCFLVGAWHSVLAVSPHTAQVRISRGEWWLSGLWVGVIALAFVMLYLAAPAEALEALEYNTWACPSVVFSISVPAAIGFGLYLRKGVALYPLNAALSFATASMALGLFGLAFICPWADPLHELLWHAFPAIMGVAALAFLGARLLRSSR